MLKASWEKCLRRDAAMHPDRSLTTLAQAAQYAGLTLGTRAQTEQSDFFSPAAPTSPPWNRRDTASVSVYGHPP
jgi:hypothetical protein